MTTSSMRYIYIYIYIIGAIIPPGNTSIMDSIPTTAPHKIEDLKIYSNNFHLAFNLIKANKDDDKPVFTVYVSRTHVDRF